jgi:hypothetical protein
MRCRYCNIALATSRSLVDGEFCCDDHRQSFESNQALADAPSNPTPSALERLRVIFAPRVAAQPIQPETPPEMQAAEIEFSETPELADPDPMWEPADDVEPVFAESPQQFEAQFEAEAEAVDAHPHPAPETATSGRWVHKAWKGAPRDLKLVTLLLPVVLVIAVSGTLPKMPIQQLAPQNLDEVQSQVQKVVALQWKNVNQTISDRAAVAFADDFRSGLDAWESRSNLTRSWSYDAAGFVRPGPLAIFKPTVDLSDYRFEFLGEIDQKAIGWAFRAQDLNNYYAMKFVVVKPGPLPLVHMVRYAVINGKEGPHVDKPLPMTVRTDMLYRIQVDTRGPDFTIMAQGQVVDFWSDSRLRHGGVGFFSNRGERARLRWVEVSHQYDALGRLCAYLAPYGIEGRNGNIN